VLTVADLIVLPYHQDERLSDRSIRFPDGMEPTMVDPRLPDANQWVRLTGLYDPMAAQVSRSAKSGGLTRVVTGDCLATLGTLVGLQWADLDPSLVWFDAHGDVHTVRSSTSGYLGGMALRMAMGGDPELLAGPLGLGALAEDRVVLVDARDLDPAEVSYLSGSSVYHTTVEDVAVSDLPDGPILLHIDVDVIDPREIPGLRFPASNGPPSQTVLRALDGILASGRVVALDVACPWLEPASTAESVQRSAVLARLLALGTP
jgi:arginase